MLWHIFSSNNRRNNTQSKMDYISKIKNKEYAQKITYYHLKRLEQQHNKKSETIEGSNNSQQKNV